MIQKMTPKGRGGGYMHTTLEVECSFELNLQYRIHLGSVWRGGGVDPSPVDEVGGLVRHV